MCMNTSIADTATHARTPPLFANKYVKVKEEDEAAAVEADWKESISRHFFKN